MRDDAICLLCDGNLVDGPETNEITLHDIAYQTCENCGCYGFYLNQEERIRALDETDRKVLLKDALSNAEDYDIPVIIL